MAGEGACDFGEAPHLEHERAETREIGLRPLARPGGRVRLSAARLLRAHVVIDQPRETAGERLRHAGLHQILGLQLPGSQLRVALILLGPLYPSSMQQAGAEGALMTPNATPDALSPDHIGTPHGGRAVELFAGRAGLRIGLERRLAGWSGMSGSPARAFSTHSTVTRGTSPIGGEDVNEDIAVVLDEIEAGDRTLPDYDLLVGGFPVRTYSVAKLLNQARASRQEGVLRRQVPNG